MYRSVVVEELLSWADALLPLDNLSTLTRYSGLYLPLPSINETFLPVRAFSIYPESKTGLVSNVLTL